MKSRISWSDIKSDPLHLVWVVGYAFAAGIIISFIMWDIELLQLRSRNMSLAAQFPYIVAGGMRISDGLDRFSGKPLSFQSWNAEVLYLLLSIVITYVAMTPLFFWALRQRAIIRSSPVRSGFPWKIVVSLGFSGWYVGAIMGASLIGPYITYSVTRSLQNAQRIQANKEALIHDLSTMALEARSFYFVDVRDGGGGGRWKEIQRPSSPEITLEEIAVSKPVLDRIVNRFYPQEPSKFFLMVHDRDSLSVWGVGTEEGETGDFTNKDGRKGRHQWRATVTPKGTRMGLEN